MPVSLRERMDVVVILEPRVYAARPRAFAAANDALPRWLRQDRGHEREVDREKQAERGPAEPNEEETPKAHRPFAPKRRLTVSAAM